MTLAANVPPLEAQTRSSMTSGSIVPAPQPVAAKADADPAADGFHSFLASLWPEAKSRGIARTGFEHAFRHLLIDAEVLELLENQPEHTRPTSQYLIQLVSRERIETGRQKLAKLAPLLGRIESAYGVPRQVLLAIWGIESRFGAAMGVRPVVRSLATLAFADRRRREYWRRELLTALAVLQNGEVAAEQMVGSWAGAMGHTQFMPASYAAHAIDFDRDGRRDIWQSVPDALASTASYLKASGWMAGQPWGYEAVLPPGFDFALAAPDAARSLFEWLELGVQPPAGRRFAPVAGTLRLILPAGAKGPAFLVSRNFRAILRYNSATSYALAVGHLADRIAGGPELASAWPPGDRGLDRSEREEVQQRLLAIGIDAGQVDGLIGSQTRSAIRTFQQQQGLPADGHPGLNLLEALRRADRS